MRAIPTPERLTLVLAISAILAACGGGGGGGSSGAVLDLSLTPGTLSASIIAGTTMTLNVAGTVTGSTSNPVVVVIRDPVGMIEPDVSIFQVDANQYVATFRSAAGLAPGRHQSTIRVDLCTSQACTQRLGGADLPVDFTVLDPPAVTTLFPASAIREGSGFLLTVNGTGFHPQSILRVHGYDAQTTYISATQLRAPVPPNYLYEAVPVDVTVVTALPSATAAVSNTVQLAVLNPVPVMSSLSPSTSPINGGEFILTVRGAGFYSGSRIAWNGTVLADIARPDSTTLQTIVRTGDLAVAGNIPVTVVNETPGGGSSIPLNFAVRNLVPAITTLDPVTSVAGCGATVVAANGSDFGPGATLLWDGTPRPTTLVNATRVTALLDAADLATAGDATVSVRMPAPGGGTTAVRTFTIAASGPATTSATQYQGDARHDGYATVACPDAFPSVPNWTHALNGTAVTPLVAGGRVFAPSYTETTTEIVALDLADGSVDWGPVSVPGRAGIAYDGGRLFVANVDAGAATVRALREADGGVAWSRDLAGQTSRRMMPTAANGLLYLARAGTGGDAAYNGLIALSQATGVSSWSDPTVAHSSSQAVADGSVFDASDCSTTRRDALTGALQWSRNACSGGAQAAMTVSFGDQVYSQAAYSGWIRQNNAATGAPFGADYFGAYTSDGLPVFDPATQYIVGTGGLYALNISDGSLRWGTSYPAVWADGTPVVVNDAVLISDGNWHTLHAFDTATGELRWSVPGGVTGFDFTSSEYPPVTPAVGENALVVPRLGEVQAYRIGH